VTVRWTDTGVRLADVPGSGVGRIDRNARSGNPRHDTRSGKFAVGSGVNKKQVAPPANVDPMAYKRQLDAVRDAARQLSELNEASALDFLKGRAQAPEQVDIANFLAMVTEQRKADLIDIADASLREADDGKIRVVAPDGLVREHISQLGSAAVGEIMERLEAMGHKRSDVRKFFDNRIEAVEEAEKANGR